ncbi:MAG: hypothetical protein J6L76_02255 [Clostridia bacterium]|nr:hypothetical protein [Clostridia bacterium]
MEIETDEGIESNLAKYQFVTRKLHQLSISPGMAGFYYLRDAILFADDLGKPVPAIQHLVCEEMMKRYGIDRRKLDRSIHTVLDQLSKNMTRAKALRIITGIEVDCINQPFKNIEFISFMVEALHLEFMDEMRR